LDISASRLDLAWLASYLPFPQWMLFCAMSLCTSPPQGVAQQLNRCQVPNSSDLCWLRVLLSMGQWVHLSSPSKTRCCISVHQYGVIVWERLRIVSTKCRYVYEKMLTVTTIRYAWPPGWSPSYTKSCMICFVTNSLGLMMCWVFKKHLHRLNQKAEREERQSGRSQGYRYML
jgi:hypothetical protein